MAKIVVGRVLSADTDSVSTKELNQLVPAQYDHIALSYVGGNITSAVYKQGGAGGTTIATLTLTYTGSRLDAVTRT